jgi:hypothetical protein
MASWSTLISATGFGLDTPRKTLTFAPSLTDGTFRAPWFTPSGWGMFFADGDRVGISVMGGRIDISVLRIGGLPGPFHHAVLNNKPQRFDLTTRQGVIELSFHDGITIHQNEVLELQS